MYIPRYVKIAMNFEVSICLFFSSTVLRRISKDTFIYPSCSFPMQQYLFTSVSKCVPHCFTKLYTLAWSGNDKLRTRLEYISALCPHMYYWIEKEFVLDWHWHSKRKIQKLFLQKNYCTAIASWQILQNVFQDFLKIF